MFKGGAASTSDGLLGSISASATQDAIGAADWLKSSFRIRICVMREQMISAKMEWERYQFLC